MPNTPTPHHITTLPILAIVLILALIAVSAVYFAGLDHETTDTSATANVTTTTNSHTAPANRSGNPTVNRDTTDVTPSSNTNATINAALNTNEGGNTNQSVKPNTASPTITGIAPCGEAAATWATYTAARGFSFRYPPSLHITTSTDSGTTFHVAADDRPNEAATYTTSLNVWITPDGLGGVTGGKLFRLRRADGGLNIVGEDDATHASDRFAYIAQELDPPHSGGFYITLWDENRESPALEQLFRSILCTFQIDA